MNSEAGIERAVLTSEIFIPVVALAELYSGPLIRVGHPQIRT